MVARARAAGHWFSLKLRGLRGAGGLRDLDRGERILGEMELREAIDRFDDEWEETGKSAEESIHAFLPVRKLRREKGNQFHPNVFSGKKKIKVRI